MQIEEIKHRVEREREAHTERDVLAENAIIKQRFTHLDRYPSKRQLLTKMHNLTQNLTGKIILDYGCGRGETSLKCLANGAKKVFGIDISPVYIKNAREKAIEAGYPEDRYLFQEMDAHTLQFPDDFFDLITGKGILHHLNVQIALDEIYRVLKPEGRVILQEPLSDNPLLKIFRFLTPKARTMDEKPLSRRQIQILKSNHLWLAEFSYCGILEMPIAMATSILIPKSPENWFLKAADKIEKWTHRKRILLTWNQYVLINLVKIG